jgi:hypothetical protein
MEVATTCLTEVDTCLTEVDTCLKEVDTCLTEVDTTCRMAANSSMASMGMGCMVVVMASSSMASMGTGTEEASSRSGSKKYGLYVINLIF